MKAITLTVTAIIATTTITAHANIKDSMDDIMQTATNPGSVSAEIGTLGYGANIAWSANDHTEVQLGYTGGDIIGLADTNLEVEGVDYEAETDFNTPYVGIQLHPLKNWFTVGMGAMYMGSNEINATATPKEGKNFTYQGKTYTAQTDAKIDANVEFKNTLAPYLSIGFRPNISNRFGIFGEIGAAYTGGLNTSVDASGSYTFKGETTKLNEAQITELEDRARQEIEDEISSIEDWYPIVKAGMTIRF